MIDEALREAWRLWLVLGLFVLACTPLPADTADDNLHAVLGRCVILSTTVDDMEFCLDSYYQEKHR